MDLKQKLAEYIRNFNFLTEDEVQLIVESTIVKSFKKGTLLLKKGQVPDKCYMILEGCLREYLPLDGEEKSTAFYMEGETVTPYTSSGPGAPSKQALECVEDCILTISNQNFEDELRRKLPRLDAIIQHVAKEKLGKAKEEWANFISSSPEERYTALLETKPALFNRVPQHQIASYLGIKPESLSRIRKRLLFKAKLSEDLV